MWLTNIKIAIVEKNTDRLNNLLDEVPKFENKQDMEEAMYLLREAAELVYKLQDETTESMKQIKRNMDFLKSTEAPRTAKLDLKS
ncbi:MAG: hypothetical protein U9Q40_08385 [Campylobacterota bacterium]|nr:hypothetical protein [Campylobacterota bacterium]